MGDGVPRKQIVGFNIYIDLIIANLLCIFLERKKTERDMNTADWQTKLEYETEMKIKDIKCKTNIFLLDQQIDIQTYQQTTDIPTDRHTDIPTDI